MSTQIKTITRAEYKGTSKSGNPYFEVIFDDATSARTDDDASINYGITNEENIGVRVEVTTNRSGRITHVKPVGGTEGQPDMAKTSDEQIPKRTATSISNSFARIFSRE